MSTITETKRLLAPKDGNVLVLTESGITEREIAEDRDSIVQRLHAAYLNLVDQMAEFQQQWDNNPAAAFVASAREGFNAGGAEWLKDQAELFEAKTWIDMAGKVKEAAGTAYDRLATYSTQRFNDLKGELNKHIEHPEDTLYNWSWWQTSISQEAQEWFDGQRAHVESTIHAAQDAAVSVLNTAEKAQKIYKHRDAILNLPSLIADGSPRPIQAFVDNELMDIDPELATAIKKDPNFALVLEVIADHDSALTYLSYVGLMLEAIPPNFYAYAAGKGGAYLMIEVVTLVVTALLSAGAAAASRIAMLVARFATATAKATSIGKKLQRAKAAVEAFIRMLEDLSNAVDDLHNLGAKLVRARSKGLTLRGRTKTTLKAKKEAIKRDKKCRLCGSTSHTTPRYRLGTVVYR